MVNFTYDMLICPHSIHKKPHSSQTKVCYVHALPSHVQSSELSFLTGFGNVWLKLKLSVEHFKSDSQNFEGMFLHNSVLS